MPIRQFLREAVFEPEIVEAMAIAFEETLRELKLTDRDDPLVELVAKIIIDCARKGDREPMPMRNCALQALRDPPSHAA